MLRISRSAIARTSIALAGIGAAAIAPAPSGADGPALLAPSPDAFVGPVAPGLSPIEAAESAGLGEDHAAEHASNANAASSRRREEGPSLSLPNAWTGGEPAEVGRWVEGPAGVIRLPNYAIHTVMLPTGKVLFWGYPPVPEEGTRANAGEAALWDPRKGTGPDSVESVDPPLLDPDGPGPQTPVPAPLYCSGQTLLPNGDVLAAGGNLVWPEQYPDDPYGDFAGLETVYVFDSFAERWVRQPDMATGRWYPSQVLLGDGRTAIVGGYDESESPPGVAATDTQIAEVFAPADANGGTGRLTTVANEPGFRTALYPHLFTLPDGFVLLAGPAAGDSARLSFVRGQPAGRLDMPSPPDVANRIGGTAVLEPAGFRGSWSAMQIGGYDDRVPANPSAPAAEYIYRAAASAVRSNGRTLRTGGAPAPNLGRAYANTVLLPDRSMVTIGGGAGRDPDSGTYYTAGEVERKRVELYDPASRSWTLGPNQREYRSYHSTAVLLPDGRVWSAGDDRHTLEPNQAGDGYRSSTSDTAELYEPPYLFAPGPRPKIGAVSRKLGYGDGFGIRTRKGRGETAVLMAPGATTHGADMHQRLVTLKKLGKVAGRGLNMKTPTARGAAPPGYYMLFVLSRTGKPSVAEWVQLTPDAKRPKLLGQRDGKGRRR